MGGLKNLHMNGWVRHNEGRGEGVDLKIGVGGNPFISNFGATKGA